MAWFPRAHLGRKPGPTSGLLPTLWGRGGLAGHGILGLLFSLLPELKWTKANSYGLPALLSLDSVGLDCTQLLPLL